MDTSGNYINTVKMAFRWITNHRKFFIILALPRHPSCNQGVPTFKGPTSKGSKRKGREKGEGRRPCPLPSLVTWQYNVHQFKADSTPT